MFLLVYYIPLPQYSGFYHQRWVLSVLELDRKGSRRYVLSCFHVNERAHCFSLLYNISWPAYSTTCICRWTSGLVPLWGHYKQSPHGQIFLWTFLLGTYLHVDLPPQRIRQRCDMGRNGHVAFREAGPSASPPQLSWGPNGTMSWPVFFLISDCGEWCISCCVKESLATVLEEIHTTPGLDSLPDYSWL